MTTVEIIRLIFQGVIVLGLLIMIVHTIVTTKKLEKEIKVLKKRIKKREETHQEFLTDFFKQSPKGEINE